MNLSDLNPGDVILVERSYANVTTRELLMVQTVVPGDSIAGQQSTILVISATYDRTRALDLRGINYINYIEMELGEKVEVE